MARALRAKLQFNDSSHPERGFGSRYHGRSAKKWLLSPSGASTSFQQNNFMASTCASINNNSVIKLLCV